MSCKGGPRSRRKLTSWPLGSGAACGRPSRPATLHPPPAGLTQAREHTRLEVLTGAPCHQKTHHRPSMPHSMRERPNARLPGEAKDEEVVTVLPQTITETLQIRRPDTIWTGRRQTRLKYQELALGACAETLRGGRGSSRPTGGLLSARPAPPSASPIGLWDAHARARLRAIRISAAGCLGFPLYVGQNEPLVVWVFRCTWGKMRQHRAGYTSRWGLMPGRWLGRGLLFWEAAGSGCASRDPYWPLPPDPCPEGGPPSWDVTESVSLHALS